MIYTVLLDNNKIGTSLLENADAPMGVVFGKLIADNNLICYNFLSKYCKDNGIGATEYPEDKLITTRTIPGLKVVNENGVEIIGLSSNLEGMDSEGYVVNIEGVPYPFYEEEFPHHKKAYDDQFG